MHDFGIAHLDLNSGNLLVEELGPGILIIDFEFGPATWVAWEQQMAFDYLRLLDDFLRPRRGGQALMNESGRMIAILEGVVPKAVGEAPMRFSLAKLQRLAAEELFRKRLIEVFPGLER